MQSPRSFSYRTLVDAAALSGFDSESVVSCLLHVALTARVLGRSTPSQLAAQLAVCLLLSVSAAELAAEVAVLLIPCSSARWLLAVLLAVPEVQRPSPLADLPVPVALAARDHGIGRARLLLGALVARDALHVARVAHRPLAGSLAAAAPESVGSACCECWLRALLLCWWMGGSEDDGCALSVVAGAESFWLCTSAAGSPFSLLHWLLVTRFTTGATKAAAAAAGAATADSRGFFAVLSSLSRTAAADQATLLSFRCD
jgi:hypothetical protein